MAADGWGGRRSRSRSSSWDPAVAASLLDPDQDNGFILATMPMRITPEFDAYFVPLAERFTRLLDAIGFPLCVGNVMATNPVWRKRISEWRRQIAIWLRKRTEAQLLLSDILFDFRHVWGDAALSESLRGLIPIRSPATRPSSGISSDRPFHSAALGWFGRLRSERDQQDRPGMINLKLRGTRPLVEAARLLALKTGVPTTSTLARLDGLLSKGAVHPDDHDELKDAFNFISRLVLRQQVESFEAGARIDDFIPEARLTKRGGPSGVLLPRHCQSSDRHEGRAQRDFQGVSGRWNSSNRASDSRVKLAHVRGCDYPRLRLGSGPARTWPDFVPVRPMLRASRRPGCGTSMSRPCRARSRPRSRRRNAG